MIVCPSCHRKKVIKNGKRKTKTKKKQIYRCKTCGYKFITEKSSREKITMEIGALSIYLYEHGASLRRIKKIIKIIYELNVHHATVARYLSTHNIKKPTKKDLLRWNR